MKTLIGKQVMHGSPGYQTPETITAITRKKHSYEMDFASGSYTVISYDDILALIDDGEVNYRDGNHGGYCVISL